MIKEAIETDLSMIPQLLEEAMSENITLDTVKSILSTPEGFHTFLVKYTEAFKEEFSL